MCKMNQWKNFSKEEIEQFVNESASYAELARKIGYDDICCRNGSAYRDVHTMIDELNLDISHFTGQGWNKNNFDYSRFRYGINISSKSALNAIAALRGRVCESCGLSTWMGQDITLEVHHKDGDSLNNELDNLQLLCPNCHSMTSNWKGRNNKKKKEEPIDEEQFKNALIESKNIRQALVLLGISPKGRNYVRAKRIIQKYDIDMSQQDNKTGNYCCDCGKEISYKALKKKKCLSNIRRQEGINNLPVKREELKELIRTTTFVQIGKKFNVSDNAIRKWCKKLNLPSKVKDINAMSDEEWDNL